MPVRLTRSDSDATQLAYLGIRPLRLLGRCRGDRNHQPASLNNYPLDQQAPAGAVQLRNLGQRHVEMHAQEQYTMATDIQATSPTREAHGSGEATKTRVAYSGSTCQLA